MFKTHLESIFLYNSELWTITKTQEKQIDSYHRWMLRKIIGIKWPETITTVMTTFINAQKKNSEV